MTAPPVLRAPAPSPPVPTAGHRTWQATLGWSLAALTVVAVVADTAITAASRGGLWSTETATQHGWPLVDGATLGSAVVGAVIVSRYPRHRIGWLLLASGTVSQLSVVAEAYSVWAQRGDGPGSDWAWHFAGWLSMLFSGGVGVSLLSIVFLIAPDNRLLSRRWRPVLWLCLLGGSLYVATALSINPSEVDVDAQDLPSYGTLPQVLAVSGALSIAVAVVAAAASMVVRLRRSQGEARLQLRWFALGATLLAGGFAWLLTVEAVNGGRQTPVASLPLFTAFFVFPVFVAVAVLRHRLFDVDLIVSRAAGLAIATAVVAAGYVAVVLAVAGKASGSGVWSSLLATALVAIAFQPLRARVVRFAHRLAYGRRAAPYEALADLSRRLGETPDAEALLPQVAAAAAHAVAATAASVSVSVGDGPALTGHWPTDRPAPAAPAAREEGVVLPIADGAERLGDLTVVLPAGRSLREAERRLLDRLGEQTALAVRNARLSAELAARVAEVDERAGELARSRRRLIDARDAERDRLESAIRTDVTAHLERLPAELDRLADRLAASPARRRLDGLADPAVAALEALRAITRGVYPAQLARFGLETVLTRADARRCRVTVDATVAGRRFPDRVEATTYFCFTELTRGHEEPVDGWLGVRDGALALRVTGATLLAGTLARMRDRVEAVGGSIDCEATATVVRIPVGAAQAAT